MVLHTAGICHPAGRNNHQGAVLEIQHFRFINRFDEAIVFRPLNKDELGQVANLIISDIAKNLQINQKLSLTIAPGVVPLLVEKGYDPTMGARPMRRIISKTIENIVANKILAGGIEAGATINVSLDDVENALGNS